MRRELPLEVFVVGVATLGLGFAIMLFPSPSEFMTSLRSGRATGPLVGCFFIGAIFHWLAEVTGINEWYVKTRQNAWKV